MFNLGVIQKYRFGSAVEEEGEFERILVCNQETGHQERIFCVQALSYLSLS